MENSGEQKNRRPAVPWWYRALAGALAPLTARWGQRGDRQAIAGRLGRAGAPASLWIHAASVGEVVGAVPVAREVLRRHSAETLYLSAITPGGRAAWSAALEGWPTGAAPVESPAAVGRALACVAPRRLLLFETEIWPEWLASAWERGVQLAVANARISDRSWKRYRALSGLFREPLSRFSAVGAQTALDADRWVELGVPADRVRVTGNSKFDGLGEHPPEILSEGARREARRRLGIDPDGLWWTWGSLRPGEEKWAERVIRELGDDAPGMLIVPRHPDRWRGDEIHPGNARVVWLRKLGILDEAYRAADLAVVGGTLGPYGGHNPAEPAVLGVPVFLGPWLANCREAAAALLSAGGAVLVENPIALSQAARPWIADSAARNAAGRAAREAVLGLAGASSRTVDWLEQRGYWS
jgi:3-deoxy-D-manno-octulosonic-acid transferase